MFYQNTTKMPYVLRESSNTSELTIALYFTWNKGEVIFTFTALPRFGTPCETIQLFHYNGYCYVNFQSTAWTSETVIVVARYFYKDASFLFHDLYRRSHLEVFCKKGVLRNFAKFTGKDQRQSLFLIKLQESLFNKEILTYVISCEFCEISKNTFCYRTPLVAASVCSNWCC